MARVSEDRLTPVLRIAESALSVAHIAQWELKHAKPNWTVRRARKWLGEQGFDVAPVLDTPRHRYIHVAELPDGVATVDEAARVIDAAHLVSADLGLAAAVALLQTQPWYFVIAGHEIVGVVTRADIQRPAVSMVTLSLILSAEEAMSNIIEQTFGEKWLDRLSPGRRDKVDDRFKARRDADVEISKLQCLMLEDRLYLVGRCTAALEDLEFDSHSQFERWAGRLTKLRNVLAHGNTLLDVARDPGEAIDLFMKTRAFAEATSKVAGTTAQSPPRAKRQVEMVRS
jgi:hypothetical protein